MSDDDRDFDVDSDDGDQDINGRQLSGKTLYFTQAEKRAHHNALERKRRDHIKDSFSSLRDAVPSLLGEKASRAQILKKAAEYIQQMRNKNASHQQDIDDLKKQNEILEKQIQRLEQLKSSASAIKTEHFQKDHVNANYDSSMSGTEDSETDNVQPRRTKRLKTNYNS